jgi:iron complex transport system substrate-binding protein
VRARFRPGHLIAAAGLAGGAWWVAAGARARVEPCSPEWRQPVEIRAAVAYPRLVSTSGRDQDRGSHRGVQVVRCPERIVAASVCSAEILLAIAPRERIAAVHWLAADPRYSLVAQQAGGMPVVGAGPEQLLTARPDLVLTDPFTSAETQVLLEAAGVPVVRTGRITDLDGVADTIRLIGWATGCDQEAERLVSSMEDRQRELASRAPQFGSWRIMNLNGALETYGRGSLLDAVIGLSGACNLPAHRGVGAFSVLDVESVLAWRPDALVVAVEPGQEAAMGEWLRQHHGLRLLPCVQRGHVVFLANALLGSTSQHAAEIAAALQARLAAWERP